MQFEEGFEIGNDKWREKDGRNFAGEKCRQTVNKNTPCLRFGKAQQISVSLISTLFACSYPAVSEDMYNWKSKESEHWATTA